MRPEPGNLQQFIGHSESLKHARTQFAALTRSLALSHDERATGERAFVARHGKAQYENSVAQKLYTLADVSNDNGDTARRDGSEANATQSVT